MPRPDDIMDIVRPRTPDFRLGGEWEIEFGDWQWFYVAGFRTQMTKAGLRDKSDVYDCAGKAPSRVPGTWRNCHRSGSWTEFAPSQIKRAISGEKMRFDKACLSILSLEIAAEQLESGYDIYSGISILPAMFKVHGYDQEFYEKNVRSNRDHILNLIKVTGQTAIEVFPQMASRAVTIHTALPSRDYLSSTHQDIRNVYLIDKKSLSKGSPSPAEKPIYLA